MTDAALALPPAASGHPIATRFGEIAIDPRRLLTLPAGLLGFAHRRRYALCELPGREVVFKLLQSVEERELAFFVLPLDREQGPIERASLEAACASLGYAARDLAVLGLVALHRETSGTVFTINLRAPVLIDTVRQIGCQHVLPDERYPIRHPLPVDAAHAS